MVITTRFRAADAGEGGDCRSPPQAAIAAHTTSATTMRQGCIASAYTGAPAVRTPIRAVVVVIVSLLLTGGAVAQLLDEGDMLQAGYKYSWQFYIQ